jgi:hypothetical protein
MPFVWKTSSIGYPNFFQQGIASAELAETFKKLAAASAAKVGYKTAKTQFTISDEKGCLSGIRPPIRRSTFG